MKYLKKFNESNSFKKEIENFCEENLAYLIDAGFLLSYTGTDRINIILYSHIKETFKWSDIVDDFVPFLQILNKKYELINLTPTSIRDKHSKKCTIKIHDIRGVYRYTLDDLINDRTDGISGLKLDYIEFSIKI